MKTFFAPNVGWGLERSRISRTRRQAGMLMAELLVAMGILVIALMPLLAVFVQTQKAARSAYQRGVAMEIMDGEMEILAAGEWREFKEGAQHYPLHADAMKNLQGGKATLTVAGKHVRLEWEPGKKDSGGTIVREADVK